MASITCEYCKNEFAQMKNLKKHYERCKTRPVFLIQQQLQQQHESEIQMQRERYEKEIEELNKQSQIQCEQHQLEIEVLNNQSQIQREQLLIRIEKLEKIILEIAKHNAPITTKRDIKIHVGPGWCPHGIRKSTCKDCEGSDICTHKIRKHLCRECDLSGYLAHICRSRIYTALKQNKVKGTTEYLGCTFGELRSYIESKFKEGMSWDNYGSEWHIDHIVPIKFENPTNTAIIEARLHYTNLQPLWALENYSKGNRYISVSD